MNEDKPRKVVDVFDEHGNIVARGLSTWQRPSPVGDVVDVAAAGRRITALVSRTRVVEELSLRRKR